ncbi:MAG TPA: hypothetical protein VNJ10_03895 [Sphingomonas sp.]|nr:hypothetical protein [Sphingomonas sp.]
MPQHQDIFALLGRPMRIAPHDASRRPAGTDMPPIAELIRRIDCALLDRRAA